MPLCVLPMQAELVGDPRTCISSYTEFGDPLCSPSPWCCTVFATRTKWQEKREKKNNRDFAYNLQIPGAPFPGAFWSENWSSLGF